MLAYQNDTIAALATAPGQGGIAIVRLSGPDSEQILSRVFRPAGKHFPLASHMLTYGHLLDEAGERIDECMAVIMRAPKSYTREDGVGLLYLRQLSGPTRRTPISESVFCL